MDKLSIIKQFYCEKDLLKLNKKKHYIYLPLVDTEFYLRASQSLKLNKNDGYLVQLKATRELPKSLSVSKLIPARYYFDFFYNFNEPGGPMHDIFRISGVEVDAYTHTEKFLIVPYDYNSFLDISLKNPRIITY